MSDVFELPLSYTDRCALIDEEDVELVMSQRGAWRLGNKGYVLAFIPHPTGRLRSDGRRVRRYGLGLHRLILGLEFGDPRWGDHKDRDRLNCCRSNLRIVTVAQNGQNQSPQVGRSSAYRGVAWHKGGQKWEAHGGINGRKVYLGLHEDELVAAAVARAWRRVHLPFSTELVDV